MLCGLALATLFARGSLVAARTWTDASGEFRVDGDFVSIEAGVATIKTDDGRTVAISVEKLSKADRDFIDGLKKPAPKANPFVEVPKRLAMQRWPTQWSRRKNL